MSADAYLPSEEQSRRAKKNSHTPEARKQCVITRRENQKAKLYACDCGREIPETRTYCVKCEAALKKKNEDAINAQKLVGLLRLGITKGEMGNDKRLSTPRL